MTTLIGWVSYTTTGSDRKTPRAVYLASDSRITWGSSARRWDAGRKLFAPHSAPHIFGYCGDVVFPSLVLGQIVSAIDRRALFAANADPQLKHSAIFESIQESFGRRHNAPDADFSILHVHRQRSERGSRFFLWQIDYRRAGRIWSSTQLEIPPKTAIIVELGTGAVAARIHAKRWSESDVGGTSRSIFSGFCDALLSGSDPLSGGPPQVAALYNGGIPRSLGVLVDEELYLHGLKLKPGATLSGLECCDRLFHRIDSQTRRRLEGARRFARPHGAR